MIWPILLLGVVSLAISWLLTALIIRVAPRIGFVDQPGHRKIHANPKPLGGGVAICVAFIVPMLAVLACIRLSLVSLERENWAAYAGGISQRTPLALALVAGMLVLHVMGLVDDRRALGPYVKLAVQLFVAGGIAVGFEEVRALTAFTYWPSIT